jgi:hypothetical protein
MAVYKLFPTQDTTLYSFYPEMNTGMDSILEVGNLNVNFNNVPQVSRYLIEFDQSQIEEIIDEKIKDKNFNIDLKCFIANAQGIIPDIEVEAYPVSKPWINGNGMYLDSPFSTNGASWNSNQFLGGDTWDINSTQPYITSSSPDNSGGGSWYTGSSNPNNLKIKTTQSFSNRQVNDLNLDVTDIVNVWYSSSKGINPYTNIENNGFIVKLEDTIEFQEIEAIQPIIQFYSVDTHTIYPPQLEIKWDDYSSETGSLPPIDTTDVFIAVDENPGIFYEESINRFRLNVRPQYPERRFQTSSYYTTNHYLPTSSYYAIKDLDTNEFVITFDEQYTKVSCDEKGNYFDIYMNGLEPERYYKILIQTTINGSTIVKDDNYYFKIVNG